MPSPAHTAVAKPSAPASVHAEAEKALTALGQALRGVLDALKPGELGPRDLEQLLGMHKTLAWRVLQVAYVREPLAAVPHVPGAEGMEKFLHAAGRKGVATELLRPVREAFGLYRSLAKPNAGDRASFDVMLMSLASPRETSVELRAARRAAFKSASYTWGVQTEVRSLSAIITPVGEDLVDLATVRSQIRARRLRREGVLRISRTVEHDTDNPGRRKVSALPIEPESVMGGVPLLRDFCTQPLPTLTSVELPDGNVEYRYVDQPLGDRASVTLFTGEVRRALAGARWRSEANSTNALMMTIGVPLSVAVIDLWAPPGFGVEHRGLVVSAVSVDPLRQKPAEWHVLPVSTVVERLGRGLPAARLSEAPAYAQVMERCFARLGWPMAEYELHRVRMEYPVLGTCLVLQTQLPDRTAAGN